MTAADVRPVPPGPRGRAAAPLSPSARMKLLQRVRKAVFAQHPPPPGAAIVEHPDAVAPLADVLFAAGDEPRTPDAVFDKMRWGGLFIYASADLAAVAEAERRFNHRGGFVLEAHPQAVNVRPLGFLPFGKKTYHYIVARKTLLIRPGQSTDRFTYHVELIRHQQFGGDYVVMKQVPTFDRVVSRLREKFPDTPMETLRRRAKKFTEKIFPVFLTREAAMLQMLQQRMPEALRCRVPRILGVEKDANGFVRTLYMNHLRNAAPGGTPLTQLQFARQSAELLHALHDVAGVIHLDLRLDNFVITRDGVGFVDFGSAVKVGESFPESSLLASLFEEMMRTSQIQRMLSRMEDAGEVTSHDIRQARHRIDKAVDFFYLAVQINSPHHNPDFVDLVRHDPASAEAAALAKLTDAILRPEQPDARPFASAKDILEGLHAIERDLAAR